MKTQFLLALLLSVCAIGQIPAPSPTPAVALPPGYTLVFDDEFQQGSSFWNTAVISTGSLKPFPGLPRYLAHTPTNEDFSNFADPSSDGWPFTADAAAVFGGKTTFPAPNNGVLTILGANVNGAPYGGLLSTADTQGGGFSCINGYWEAKIWLPPNPPGSTIPRGDYGAPGLWPAFWLLAIPVIPNPNTRSGEEIDICEAYSVDYRFYHCNLHEWYNGDQISSSGDQVGPFGDLSQGWHIYSALVTAAQTYFYFDGVQVSAQADPTDGAANVPLYGMINFAFGGGWPIDQNWGTLASNGTNTNLLLMQVAYLRVWDIPSQQQPGSVPMPTATPVPSPTVTPTATPTPSSTPVPGPTVTPTATPTPSSTPQRHRHRERTL